MRINHINEKHLKEIRGNVRLIEESVEEFLETDVPKYKKLVFESESRLQDQYAALEENVEDNVATVNLNGKVFPLGDYGDLINIRDAFGVFIGPGESYDCLTEPEGSLTKIDLGKLF